MVGVLRKHAVTILVAGATAGVTALLTGSGPAGAAGGPDIYYRRSPKTPIADNAENLLQANCPEGTHVVGGGAIGDQIDMRLEDSFPSKRGSASVTGNSAWSSRVFNASGGGEGNGRAYAICMKGDVHQNYPSGVNPVS